MVSTLMKRYSPDVTIVIAPYTSKNSKGERQEALFEDHASPLFDRPVIKTESVV